MRSQMSASISRFAWYVSPMVYSVVCIFFRTAVSNKQALISCSWRVYTRWEAERFQMTLFYFVRGELIGTYAKTFWAGGI